MSGEEDLFLNQSEAEALFFTDALLGNADDLDFESFGGTNGLDVGTFDSITGTGLIPLGNGDIFKSAVLNNGNSYADDVETKCDPNSMISDEVSVLGPLYSNGTAHNNYSFSKPTLDLENMGMAYCCSGLYLQGTGVTGLASPSSPCLNQSGIMSPSMVASEKFNGLSLGQMASPYSQSLYDSKTNLSLGYSQGVSYTSAGMMATNTGPKQFATSPMTAPVAQASVAQPSANGLTRFGSHDMVINVGTSNGLPPGPTVKESPSPVLSPDSTDGNDSLDGLLGGESRLTMSQRKYFSLQDQGGSDAPDFDDQVDGDGDGLQPLPQMTRPSMQRSYSSHALGTLRNLAPAPPSKENSFSSRHSQVDHSGGLTSPGTRMQPHLSDFQSMGGMRPLMRRVHSAGDIQVGLGGGGSPSFEEGSYRIGKYSMEERKIRIHRYQQKRTQRNFNKKIKYACRKTLADSRPRVRGRFAKNLDDDVPATSHGRKREDGDDDEGEVHLGEEENEFLYEDSSGDLSDMLGTTIKLEHRSFSSM